MRNVIVWPVALLASLMLAWAVWSAAAAPGTTSTIDLSLAARYFAEARSASARDGGRLWGRAAYGAILFVDRSSREVVANQADANGLLERRGDVFVGRLGESENIANTATEWSGTRWTMVAWPLPRAAHARATLMLHECFHRIQRELHLPASDPPNPHLDTLDGRLWLQLEWRSLEEALLSEGDARRVAVADALAFRAFRRSLFTGSAAAETALELHEGLAEYTGIRQGARSTAQAHADAILSLERAPQTATFVRSFAYASGPAYGLLLDDTYEGWRRGLSAGSDLGDLLGRALSISASTPTREEAEKRSLRYEGGELREAETEREAARQAKLVEYTKAFVTDPALVLPCGNEISYSFNPGELVPLAGQGTVFPTVRVVCEWGILEASQGALLVTDGGRITGARIVAPKDPAARPLAANGWTLELAPGWTLVPGPRTGDLTVKQQ
jgi:hypothetical protein